MGGPEFFEVVKGGGVVFFSGPKGGPEFFMYAEGGPQKIGNRPSQTDTPHLRVKMIAPQSIMLEDVSPKPFIILMTTYPILL